MYSKNFVVAILVDGQVQKHSKQGVVSLPFGVEYTIRLRNKNARRAVCKVFIDDENVSEGGIVIPANDYVDLERSTAKAVKFKFVSADSPEAYDAGKDNKTDDSNGVIRTEWRLERERPVHIPSPPPVTIRRPRVPPYLPYPPMWTGGQEAYTKGGPVQPQSLMSLDARGQKHYAEQTLGTIEGCTVEGSHSSQYFNTTHVPLESGDPVIIQMVLKGYEEQSRPSVYTQVRYCKHCGTTVESIDKFCSACGTKIRRVR